jgi:hypothetical protein
MIADGVDVISWNAGNGWPQVHQPDDTLTGCDAINGRYIAGWPLRGAFGDPWQGRLKRAEANMDRHGSPAHSSAHPACRNSAQILIDQVQMKNVMQLFSRLRANFLLNLAASVQR